MKQNGLVEDWQAGGFGIYVHWPFCKAKCPYCDFNSHVRASIDQDRWLTAYLHELDRAADEVGGRVLRSVFFGGGTPSLMDPLVVAAILDRIARHWTPANDMEVTLEANPTSVEANRFRGYAAAGVNRVSLGMQAFDDASLQRLGRQHSVQDGLAALDIAKSTFARTSFDVIYARQDQTLPEWERELRQALQFAPDHFSLYQLTVEEGTAFAKLHDAGRLTGLPDEDLAAEMYMTTATICAEAGLSAYEVSNYAVPGAESRHNLVYWRLGDYLGIGPGAHGRLTLNGIRTATTTHRLPEAWLSAVQRTGSGETPRDRLTGKESATEYLLMSLRLTEGTSLARYAAMAGQPLSDTVLHQLQDEGFLDRSDDLITATDAGRLLLNQLILRLLPD